MCVAGALVIYCIFIPLRGGARPASAIVGFGSVFRRIRRKPIMLSCRARSCLYGIECSMGPGV